MRLYLTLEMRMLRRCVKQIHMIAFTVNLKLSLSFNVGKMPNNLMFLLSQLRDAKHFRKLAPEWPCKPSPARKTVKLTSFSCFLNSSHERWRNCALISAKFASKSDRSSGERFTQTPGSDVYGEGSADSRLLPRINWCTLCEKIKKSNP